jgi:succinate dehydrogenase / fumarate reductase iron-sulfur subunit
MATPLNIERQKVEANIRVHRFNPEHDRAPYFDVYKVEVETGMTVLEVLQVIKETQDSTLTFRASCRSSICGSCAVRINEKPVLACSTQVIPTLVAFWKSSVTISPLKGLPNIRDLVVDIDPALEKLSRLHPYLMENKEWIPETLDHESLMSREELKTFNRNTDCILCACCFSTCSAVSVDPGYAGPFSLAKAYRFSADPRDSFKRPRMQAAQDYGLWSCAQCRKCITVCPKDTRPAVAIQRLRKISIDDGIHNTPGSRRAKAYMNDVAKFGQVNKPILPVVVNGPKGWAAVEAEEGYLRKYGLTHSLQVPTLPGQPHVARIYQRVRELTQNMTKNRTALRHSNEESKPHRAEEEGIRDE